MDDALGIRGALKDRAALDQLFAQSISIGDVSIVGNRGTTHGKLAKERLHITDHSALRASRGIAHVANRQRTRECFHQGRFGEVIAHIAKTAGRVEPLFGIMTDDPARFLTAVLQGVKP